LVPEKIDNILDAGSNVAYDASSHTFMREIPKCWLTGQAAGVAAALAADSGARPRDLAASAIQRELLHQGAYLSPTIEAGMQPASAAE
jgi:hypothetical protein